MYDVAVVGGGPAGCAAAITLARLGRSVVLLERTEGARDTLCGEFLSPDGVGSLETLGALDDVLAASPAVVTCWSVRGASSALRGSLPAPALGISRRVLDPTLRAAAAREGVDVRTGTHVRRVDARGSDFGIVPSDGPALRARHVIGATGRAARIPGLTDRLEVGSREYVAFKAHFRGSTPTHRIRLFPLDGAYVGMGPIEEGLVNLCYLARRETWETAGATPDALLHSAAKVQHSFASHWSGLELASERWLTTGGLFFHSRTAETRPGVTLCGDAAGLISPFLGEGMSMALEAGALAGAMTHRRLDRPDLLAQEYAEAWAARFERRMRWGERLQRLLLSERADLAIRCLALAPAIGQLVVRRSRSRSLADTGLRALRDRALIPT